MWGNRPTYTQAAPLSPVLDFSTDDCSGWSGGKDAGLLAKPSWLPLARPWYPLSPPGHCPCRWAWEGAESEMRFPWSCSFPSHSHVHGGDLTEEKKGALCRNAIECEGIQGREVATRSRPVPKLLNPHASGIRLVEGLSLTPEAQECAPHVPSCGPGYWDSSWAALFLQASGSWSLSTTPLSKALSLLSCSLSWGLLGRDLQRGWGITLQNNCKP